MNDQATAIVKGAIDQLAALATSQQAEVDADTRDAAVAQAKLDADQADIVTKSADVTSTKAIAASLSQLVAVPPAPTPPGPPAPEPLPTEPSPFAPGFAEPAEAT